MTSQIIRLIIIMYKSLSSMSRVYALAKIYGFCSEKSAPSFKIYGASFCGPCTRAKKFLDSKSIKYTYIDTQSEPQLSKLLQLKKKYNWPTIPMIFFKGKFIGGQSDMMQKIKNKQIDLNAIQS